MHFAAKHLATMSTTPAEVTNNSKAHFKSVSLAAIAVSSVSPANGANATLRRGVRGKKLAQKYSLEDLPTIEGTSATFPQLLASEGNLDDLKKSIEGYGLTLKETDKNDCTLLHHAAATNQIQVMQYLIESGINMDAVNKEGNTALHVATINGNTEAIHLLLCSGASDKILNLKTEAPLHIAAVGANNAVLSVFLEHSVDLVVSGYRDRTPLHIIAEHDNLEGCELFHQIVLSKYAMNDENNVKQFKLCASDSDGLTPIHLAARSNSHKVLDFLITKCKDHGYPIDTVLGFLDEENSTPLHAAVDSGNFEVVSVLLKHGANPLAQVEDMAPPLHLACSQGKLDMVKCMVKNFGKDILGHLDQYSRTPLHHSALSIHSASIITYILQEGGSLINLNPQDSRGNTPLHTAIMSGNLSGVKELLHRGADPLLCDNKGCNALYLVVWRKRKVMLELLLQLHCSLELVTTKNKKGCTPIHIALELGYGDFVAPMISSIRFQLQNIKDNNGNNYLHLAAKSGNWKALTTLLDIPDTLKLLNETTTMGTTPLHCAAKAGHVRCVELLLQSGAMIHKCCSGITPFMLACKEGHPECAKLLYEAHPFQIDWQDYCGNTALHYAAQSHNPVMVKQLLDAGCRLFLNSDMESFFDVIISNRDKDTAMQVIKNSRWQECLDFDSPTGTETMVKLIEDMPEIAMAVLDRCHKKSPLNKTHPDYWEKFNFKYISARHCQKAVNNSMILRDESSDQLNAGMQIRYKGSLKGSTPTINTNIKKKCKASATTATLLTMMEYKRVNLLIHPVITEYLRIKWRNYGQMIHSLFCLEYFMLVVLLTAFIIIVPRPVITQSFNSTSLNYSDDLLTNTSMEFQVIVPPLPISAEVIRVLALVINTIIAPILTMTLISAEWRTFNFVQHIPEWIYVITIIVNYIFLLAPNPLAIWPMAAVACFFSWLSAGLLLGLFTVFGIYVQMFIAITRTAFQVLVLCIFLLMAFACAFYVLAGHAFPSFSSVGYSLFTMFGYMLGEIQYDMFILVDSTGNLQNGQLVFIFVVLFAILMSIVMANLLIGLAVGDIERVKMNAILEKRRVEINYYSDVDRIIANRYIRLFRRNPTCIASHKKYPNAPVSFIRRMWREIWRSVKDEVFVNDNENADTVSPAYRDISADLEMIKRQISELSDMINHMHDKDQLLCRKRNFRLGSNMSLDSSNSESFSESDSFHTKLS